MNEIWRTVFQYESNVLDDFTTVLTPSDVLLLVASNHTCAHRLFFYALLGLRVKNKKSSTGCQPAKEINLNKET